MRRQEHQNGIDLVGADIKVEMNIQGGQTLALCKS